MDTFIALVVIACVVGFIAYKKGAFEKFKNPEEKPEAPKPEVYVAPIDVKPDPKPEPKPESSTPVLQPNVGLAGFRITPEAAAILDARVREDQNLPPAPPPPSGLPHTINKFVVNENKESLLGVNHVVAFSPVKQWVNVAAGMRIDATTTAETSSRGGAFIFMCVKDAQGNVILNGGNAANGSTVYLTPEGSSTLEYWSDTPCTCWVVFR